MAFEKTQEFDSMGLKFDALVLYQYFDGNSMDWCNGLGNVLITSSSVMSFLLKNHLWWTLRFHLVISA